MTIGEGGGAIAWRSLDAKTGGACVFIDRDGVVNERIMGGYVLSWDQFVWRPDAFRALLTLHAAGWPVVVVSNQSCVGRGLIGVETLTGIMNRMTQKLADNGSPLTA